MRQFKHGLFTSLHLLLGLCETGIPPLPDSIRRAGESPERVASAVRAKAAGLARAGGHIGLTRSVRRAHQNAAELASRDGRCAVTGQDILAGLLQCGRCEATRTLSSLGFRPHALVEEGDTANGHAG
jgi:ATP-dependent Clp protease ATP-binding subunit ClpA